MAITERLLPSSPGSSLNQERPEEEGEDMGEKINDDYGFSQPMPPDAVCAYGVCIVDSTTGMFMLGQFEVMCFAYKQIITTILFYISIYFVLLSWDTLFPDIYCYCNALFYTGWQRSQ